MKDGVMYTVSGKEINLNYPDTIDYDIEDIAHALSMQCRFNGHIDLFYSVAEHCYILSSTFEDPQLSYEALLHDAAEAYIGDIIYPVKSIPGMSEAIERLEEEIAGNLMLTFKCQHCIYEDPEGRIIYRKSDEVNKADKSIAKHERFNLAPNCPGTYITTEEPIKAATPMEAKSLYLQKFKELSHVHDYRFTWQGKSRKGYGR